MPQREVEISSRVRLFRKEHLKWSQPAFAKELLIDSYYLSNLEHGRTPLRYELAERMFKQFPLNPRWLATGEAPMVLRVPLPSREQLGVDERSIFSRVFDEKLSALSNNPIDAALHWVAGSSSYLFDFQAPDPASRVHAVTSLSIDLFTWIAQVPDARLNEFVSAIHRRATSMLAEMEKDSPQIICQRHQAMEKVKERNEVRMFLLRHGGKEDLTLTEETIKQALVNGSFVKALIANVKKATEARGSRTRLAEALGVTPQRLNDWLSGEHDPSAETALGLLLRTADSETARRVFEWLKANATNEKAPERVTSTPESVKTQTHRKSSHENPKSRPKKKR